MKNLTLFSLVALASGFAMIMSCKKGDTGPKGPAGPDSVQYSNWAVMAMTPFAGDTVFYEDFTVKALTQSIIDKGTILGYVGYIDQGGDTVVQNAADALSQYFLVGQIHVESYYQDLSGSTFYRYVLIPGTVSVSSVSGSPKIYTVDELKKMTYQQVTQSLGIPAKGGAGSLKLNSSN